MLLSFRDEVEAALADALAALDIPTDDLGVERPPENVDAVLASSVAFRAAEEAGSPPPVVANDIAGQIDASEYEYIDSVVTLGPYVNFLPSGAYYEATLEAAQDADYGRLEPTGESVVVEHTSANPTGPVHVGRARNPIIGDALCRVLDFAGHDVERHYYVNDAGRQMAVFTWAYETFDEADLSDPDRDAPDYDLVRYYRKGNAFLEEADPDEVEAAEEEIQALIQGMEAGDEEAFDRVAVVVDEVLAGMRETLDRLGVEFDEFVKETRFMRDGSTEEVVDQLQESGYAEQTDDGAWALDLEDWDIDKEFVFLRSDGSTLYTTRDLAHHEWKFANFDRAITVLGEDQRLHAHQLRAALEILNNDTERLEELFYGWVNLPGGQGMSTRRGTGVDVEDLLDEAIERARNEVEVRLDDRTRGDLTKDDIERIARQVGIGAVRYDIVAKQPSKAITFEWDRALDFEAQSAPYVQYVHARTCGILERAETVADDLNATVLETPEEQDLLETIARFPAVVEEAAADREPHAVATYTREFAETFNAFYRECPVLDTDVPEEVRTARLGLVAAARRTVANALNLLGIEAPRSM